MYDGNTFKNFPFKSQLFPMDNKASAAIQSIFEDSKGRFWFGCSGGLYRLDKGNDHIINITTEGPW